MPAETDPRSALAEALRPTFAEWFEVGHENGRLDTDVLVDAALTALSERGYTIVASDRLAEADFAVSRVHDLRLRVDPEAVAAFDAACWAVHDILRAALSRSEATEKGAPRE